MNDKIKIKTLLLQAFSNIDLLKKFYEECLMSSAFDRKTKQLIIEAGDKILEIAYNENGLFVEERTLLVKQMNEHYKKADWQEGWQNITVPFKSNHVTTFNTFQEWVDKASTRTSGIPNKVFVDSEGYLCENGGDMIQAKFPVYVYQLSKRKT